MGEIALRPQNAQGMFSNVVLQIRKVRLLYCMHTTMHDNKQRMIKKHGKTISGLILVYTVEWSEHLTGHQKVTVRC